MTAHETAGATRALARQARAIRYETLPAEVREVARHCVLDCLGTALAGSHEPLVRVLVDEIVASEAGSQASLIGRSERATARSAALVNGAAAHALDFDDTHIAMGHPSVPVLPALLALAERTRPSGRDLLAAFVAGVELECRLGVLITGSHYAAGFHSTGTLGAFGAAAACAHLLGLEEEAWLHALGLAGTQAAGLKSGFGSMAKPFHAGHAASVGLLSALLARGGFVAQPAIVECGQGFAATHAGREPDAEALATLPEHWQIRDTLFKYHAACYLTHAAIESARELRERHALDPEKVESVTLRVHPMLLDVCNIAEPSTGLELKFSLRGTTALSLLGAATGDPGTFSEAQASDPELCALRDRVTVETDEGLRGTQTQLRLATAGGTLEAEADTGLPAQDLAVQDRRLREKFELLATPRLGAEGAARLADAVNHLEQLDAADTIVRLACEVPSRT